MKRDFCHIKSWFEEMININNKTSETDTTRQDKYECYSVKLYLYTTIMKYVHIVNDFSVLKYRTIKIFC